MVGAERVKGMIETFDDAAGLGTVRLDDGRLYPFHCVSLTDGSRRIDEGRRVEVALGFRVARVEAVDITSA